MGIIHHCRWAQLLSAKKIKLRIWFSQRFRLSDVVAWSADYRRAQILAAARRLVKSTVSVQRYRSKAMSEEKTMKDNLVTKPKNEPTMNRREAVKGLAVVAATAALGGTPRPQAADQPSGGNEAKNPYGGGPGTGISLPPYYKPTPSIVNANN